MTVSKVREGLTEGHLGPAWAPGDSDGARARASEPPRAEALAWAKRQLAWEHRLTALQEARAKAGEGSPADEGSHQESSRP